MVLRYFQVNCKHCKREFSIQAEEGVTVKCNWDKRDMDHKIETL